MNQASDNQAYWQRTAKLYAPFMRSSSRLYEDICRRIAPHLTAEMDVLELACGTGQLSFPLSGRVSNWEATDFSPNMVAEAQRRQPHSEQLRFSVQDATALPYAAGSFDAVVISNALHIMPRPEAALEEIHRMLKPGGWLFAPTFVHGEASRARLRTRLMRLTGFHTYSSWSAEDLVSFVSQRGFAVIEHESLGSVIAPLCCLIGKSKDKI